jgi:uncharacterized protein YgiM (DUF1202 family)
MYISEDIIGINGKVRLKKGTKVNILKEGKPALIEDENKERYYISNDFLTETKHEPQQEPKKKHAVPNRKR